MCGRVMHNNPCTTNMEEEDPVVSTLPLHLCTRLAPYLHTIHNPPALVPEEDNCGAVKCKLKPKHGWLWMETPLDSHHYTVDRERTVEFSRSAQTTSAHSLSLDMSSSKGFVGDIQLSTDGDRFVMVRTDQGVFLTPLCGHVDMRPSLLGVDLMASQAAADQTTNKNKFSEEQEQKIMPTFQKRETEEQQLARLSSYDHLHKVWEEEQWADATYFGRTLEETVGVSSRLVSSGTEDTLPTFGISTFMRNMGIINSEKDNSE